MITHVGVQFRPHSKIYTYLCRLQNVQEGDILLVRVGNEFELVRCRWVQSGRPPFIATKHILDKIYPEKYKNNEPHIEDCLAGAL